MQPLLIKTELLAEFSKSHGRLTTIQGRGLREIGNGNL